MNTLRFLAFLTVLAVIAVPFGLLFLLVDFTSWLVGDTPETRSIKARLVETSSNIVNWGTSDE